MRKRSVNILLYVYSAICLIGGLLIVNAIYSYQSIHIDPAFWTTLKYQVAVLPLFLAASMLIGYGVKFGHKVLGNLTFVLTVSKGIEIVICVLMGFLFMREIPTWKTWLGLSIVVVGFFITKMK
ncbi:hypothetical protein [Paenibacillus sp. 481]|uniref:hypothetical protein n=1 Tax=Paenibacillus sp. 481 TaxID=2835869 RepID=UPI001E652B26|nr:hypothetical protein [Paenibacillus sp. 481]UHA73564.1 hypothetical protein KIK04_23960 [Paenibacillus sp. 481]